MPDSVGSPIAAANSATLNSATHGAPGPATGMPVSPHRVPRVAASWIESTECIAAHSTASCSLATSARSATAVSERTATSTAAAVSAWARVSVMGPVKR